MKTLLISAIVLFSILTTSCKKESEYAKYEGTWNGTYSGEDTGVWTATLNAEGEFNGTATSDSIPGYPYGLEGTITQSGELTVEAEVFGQTVHFNGELSESTGSGTWVNTDAQIQGTWEGKKD